MSLIAGEWGGCETAPRKQMRGPGFWWLLVGLFFFGVYFDQICLEKKKHVWGELMRGAVYGCVRVGLF